MDFNEFKDSLFGSDKNKALQCIADEQLSGEYKITGSKENLEKIIDSMDEKTKNELLDFRNDNLKKVMKDKKEEFKEAFKIIYLLEQLKLSEDDIRSNKNPFVKGLFVQLLITAVLFAVFVIASYSVDFIKEYLSAVLGVVSTAFSYMFATTLLKVIRFNKLKKLLGEKDISSLLDEVQTDETKTVDEAETDADKDNQIISRLYIYDYLKKFLDNKFGLYFVVGGLVSLIFFACCFVEAIAFVFFIASFAFSVFMSVKTKIRQNKLKNMRFYVVEDVCENKKIKIRSDAPNYHYLFFKNHKKYRIDLSHGGMFMQNYFEESMFDSISVGDTCYLVMLEGDDTVFLAAPANSFSLDENEFDFSDNVYKAKKDSTLSQLVEKERVRINNVFSDRQNDATANAKKCVSNTKKMSLWLILTTLAAIAWAFVGPMFLKYRIIYLAVQLLLSVIPAIYSWVLVVRSKKAVDKVREDQIDYHDISKSHNIGTFLIFALSGVNLMAMVICVMFMRM